MKKIFFVLFSLFSLASLGNTLKVHYGDPQSVFRDANGYLILSASGIDTVSFECGSTFYLDHTAYSYAFGQGELNVFASGTASHHCVINSFVGTHGIEAPIITARKRLRGSNIAGNWVSVGTNLWAFNMTATDGSGNPYQNINTGALRFWLTGQGYAGDEPDKANGLAEVTSSRRYAQDFGFHPYLYLYSVGNPATAYSNIEYSGDETSAITLGNCNYLDIDFIDLRGSSGVALFGIKSDHLTLRYCKIGWDASHAVASFVGYNSNTLIEYCTFDTGDRKFGTHGKTYLIQGGVSDVLTIDAGTHNFICRWSELQFGGHDLITFLTTQDSTSTATGSAGFYFKRSHFNGPYVMSNVDIYENVFRADSVDYCRLTTAYASNNHTYHFTFNRPGSAYLIDTTFYLEGGADKTTNIRFRRNYVGKVRVQSQLGFSGFQYIFNVHDDITGPTITEGQNKAAALTFFPGNHGSPDHMIIANNTWNGSRNGALLVRQSNPADLFFYDSTGLQRGQRRGVYVTQNGYDNIANNLIANNIFNNVGYGASEAGESYIPQGIGLQVEYYDAAALIGANTFRNNLFYSNYNGGNNLYYYNKNPILKTGGLASINAAATDLAGSTFSGNITGNPLFISPATGDFSLLPLSPAKGTGYNLSDYSLGNGLLPGSHWPLLVNSGDNTAPLWNIGAFVNQLSIPTLTQYIFKRKFITQ